MISSTGLRTRGRSRHGFTLLELIVVLALLAGLMAVSAPSLRGMLNGRRADEEARRLLTLLEWAPVEAASCGQPLLVWLDPTAGEYGMMTADDAQTERFHATVSEALRVVVNKEALGLEGTCVIVARPDGTLSCETPCVITIEHPTLELALNLKYDENKGVFALETNP